MEIKDKNILVTGAAGFIGFHLSRKLLEMDVRVIGIDNLNSYYDVNLKMKRLELLKSHDDFVFYKEDIQVCSLHRRADVSSRVEDIAAGNGDDDRSHADECKREIISRIL